MDCREAKERLLESFDGVIAPLDKSKLDAHISDCLECVQFAAMQGQLDLRLREEIAPPQLSPGFRAALQVRIARERRNRWPEWLPDVAYLAGSGPAVVTCAFVLPLPVPVVLGTGALVALLAYSLQTLLFSTLEERMD